MTREEAIREIRKALTEGGKYLNAELSRAMNLLESEPQPIGYIEPGRTYVFRLTSWPIEGVFDQIMEVAEAFKNLGCGFILIPPEMELIDPKDADVERPPADGFVDQNSIPR